MRQTIKYSIFFLFWLLFSIIFLNFLFTLTFEVEGDNLLSLIPIGIGMLCIILSLMNKWVITSPRLGRKILHETGTYYLDFKIEKMHFDVKITMILYADKILFKKQIDQIYLTDMDENLITKQLNKSLDNIQKEHNIRNEVRGKKSNVLNLKSIQNQRIDKMRSLF